MTEPADYVRHVCAFELIDHQYALSAGICEGLLREALEETPETTWTLLTSELPEGQQALHIYVRWCHGCDGIETRVDGDPTSGEGWLPTTRT